MMIHLFEHWFLNMNKQANKQASSTQNPSSFALFCLFFGGVKVFNAVKFFHLHHPQKVSQFLQQ